MAIRYDPGASIGVAPRLLVLPQGDSLIGVDGNRATDILTATPSTLEKGPAVAFSASRFTFPLLGLGATPTLLIWFRNNSNASRQALLGSEANGTISLINNSGTLGWLLGGSGVASFSGLSLTVGGIHCAALSYLGGTARSALDGVSGPTASPGVNAAWTRVVVGNRNPTGASSEPASIDVLMAAVFDVAMPDAALRLLTADPKNTLRPRRILVPVAAGGGGAFKSAWARGSNTVISAGART